MVAGPMTASAVDTAGFDLLIIGSGAGGLAAAVAAVANGMHPLVCERTEFIGGTSALSGGELWIPLNRQAGPAPDDSEAEALEYLKHAVGTQLDEQRAAAYVHHARDALAFFEQHGNLAYELLHSVVDYFEVPGAKLGLRSLGAIPFDGRRLGDQFSLLRAPLAVSQFFGGLSVGREDLPHFLGATRSLSSALRVAGLLARYASDRLRGYRRGTRLVMGNALVARLASALFERDVPIWLHADVTALDVAGGKVVGAQVRRNGRTWSIRCSKGVVLAAGGFAGSREMQRAHYPHVRQGLAHRSHLPPSNDGTGLRLAIELGASLDMRINQAGAWTPVSEVPRPNGSTDLFPHFGDRAKPGVLAVDGSGRRFANEACCYHDFVTEMFRVIERTQSDAFWLISSHRWLRRQGLGRVPPAPAPVGPYLRNGYLIRGRSVADLARRIGVDVAALSRTVQTFDRYATSGEDPDFGRGSTIYQRAAGDPAQKPNPCVAPLGDGPYYAIKMLPGDIGNTLGLRVDDAARVLGSAGEPIPGLYATGNSAASLMGGTYPAAGIMLGQAITFGYLAVKTAKAAG